MPWYDLLPPLLLGVVIAGYWGRVLRMAQKAKRQAGRAANIVPAEKLGRVIRIIWFPVVVIWVALPFVAAFGRSLPAIVRPLFYSPYIAWPALGIAGGCLWLSRVCWRAMGKNWRMGIDPQEQNPLISIGPFSRLRHPIYSLSALMMLASMGMIPSPLMLAVGVVHIALLLWEARREELHLLSIHGEQYASYMRKVGGFVPRF